jgi:hypothetical protein
LGTIVINQHHFREDIKKQAELEERLPPSTSTRFVFSSPSYKLKDKLVLCERETSALSQSDGV